MGQLQDIVGETDEAPFGGDLLDAAQQELAEAARLFEVPRPNTGSGNCFLKR